MTAAAALAALDLPTAACVDRRVPKTLLLEHGAPTPADRRRVSEGIEHIQWVAALKPTTIGVAVYRDDVRTYLEIQVFRVLLRAEARAPRLLELIHRAVPYPVLAVTEQGDRLNLSLAHKRQSLGEADKTVLDGPLLSVEAPGDGAPHQHAFAAALALGQQPQSSLLALYQGWLDTVLALEAARLTGKFAILPTAERRAERREALQECARLEAEMVRLRAAAAREKQMARRVELNAMIKKLNEQLTMNIERLGGKVGR
jgi:hypothetical protein